MKITKLEKEMIKKIALDEMTFINGEEPENIEETITYADGIIETSQDKGVFSSLLKKNIVNHDVCKNKDDNTVSLTELGFHLYKSLK